MKRKSKSSRKTRSKKNMTRHRRAVSQPETKAAISELRRIWVQINKLERGDRLLKLLNLGCSTRGLAETLGVSPTSVRRHIALSELPEPRRTAVMNGASAKRILGQEAQEDRIRRMRERLSTDAQTGVLSDAVANAIIAFCTASTGVPDSRIDETRFPQFIEEVRRALSRLVKDGVPNIKLSARSSMEQCFRKTRPDPDAHELLWDHHSTWLATYLLVTAQEWEIRERAIEKAKKRQSELRIVLTPREQYLHRAQHLAEISAGPPRRRF